MSIVGASTYPVCLFTISFTCALAIILIDRPEPEMDLLLRGTIVTPTETLHGGWVAVDGGRIAA
jgi:hypothetical protein